MLLTKKTVTNLAIHHHWNFFIGLHGRSLFLYKPRGIIFTDGKILETSLDPISIVAISIRSVVTPS